METAQWQQNERAPIPKRMKSAKRESSLKFCKMAIKPPIAPRCKNRFCLCHKGFDFYKMGIRRFECSFCKTSVINEIIVDAYGEQKGAWVILLSGKHPLFSLLRHM